jgi:DtxR family Mn-dependent transcriptional regulator
MLTLTEENYLKAIFHVENTLNGTVSTKAISESLDVKAASVTDMLKRLSEGKLVVYEKSKGVKLTEKGRKSALQVIRKHRLWETFLVDKLKFSWDEVHEVAEQLEHIHSERLIEKLDAFLDYPKFDPHGDPIPDARGKMTDINAISLTQAKLGISYKIVMVKDDSAAFLKYVDKVGLSLGDTITVKEIEEYDGSIIIRLTNKRDISLSNQSAIQLFVIALKN